MCRNFSQGFEKFRDIILLKAYAVFSSFWFLISAITYLPFPSKRDERDWIYLFFIFINFILCQSEFKKSLRERENNLPRWISYLICRPWIEKTLTIYIPIILAFVIEILLDKEDFLHMWNELIKFLAYIGKYSA